MNFEKDLVKAFLVLGAADFILFSTCKLIDKIEEHDFYMEDLCERVSKCEERQDLELKK